MSDKITVGEGTISLMRGDITDMEFDAFVFYATNDLQLGSGFGTAVSMRGGPKIQEELNDLAPVETTQAVATQAGNLKAKSIIHAVGPKFQEEDVPGKLRETIINSLRVADGQDIAMLAFPPMGTGFYCVPLDLCADVMITSLSEYLQSGGKIKDLTICVGDNREYQPFADRLQAVGV